MLGALPVDLVGGQLAGREPRAVVDGQWVLRAAILATVQALAIGPSEAGDCGGWINGGRLFGFTRVYASRVYIRRVYRVYRVYAM